MPDLSAAPVVTQRKYQVSVTDFTGRSRSALVPIGTDTTTPEITAVRTAIGNMSNGRVMSTNLYTSVEQLNPANVLNTAFDEAHATVSIVAVFIYQDDTGDTFAVEVGAPDAQIFAADGDTILTTHAYVVALNAAVLAAANNGGVGTYAFQRGFRSVRSEKRNRARTPLTLTEPGAGLPSAAPGA